VIPSGNDYIPRPFKLGFLDVGAICLEGFFFLSKIKIFYAKSWKIIQKIFFNLSLIWKIVKYFLNSHKFEEPWGKERDRRKEIAKKESVIIL
jgi:hypothetical protein